MTDEPPLSTPVPPTRMSRVVIGLSCVNLLALCAVSYVLFGISETWWLGTVLTYAPRTPYLAPTIILLLASFCWQRDSVGINLVSLMIVLAPIMGLSLPLERWLNGPAKLDGEISLKVLSCNVQAFQPDFDKVLEEIASHTPDLIAMQETFRGDPRLDQAFTDWHTLQHGQYWIGSRFPLKFLADCEVTQFGGRMAGMIVEVETPGGPIVLVDLHQMTARYGLKELNRNTLINLDGTKELEGYVVERYAESADIRALVDANRGGLPMIVCGDFNVPTSSSLFQKFWGDLQSSFDVAGFGYGYTSPCKGNRFWPNNLPWARIDHILSTKDFRVRECQIGTSDGSDHRLIVAKLAWKTAAR